MANAQILVVGDGHNDISMIETTPPCHTACPSNAVVEVVEAVHRTHGHIASERNLNGVMEVIAAYESGRVNEKLPEGWDGGGHAPVNPRTSPRGSSGLWNFVVVMLVLYTTILVLCTFVHVPGRERLMKPYMKLVERISLVIDLVRD